MLCFLTTVKKIKMKIKHILTFILFYYVDFKYTMIIEVNKQCVISLCFGLLILFILVFILSYLSDSDLLCFMKKIQNAQDKRIPETILS